MKRLAPIALLSLSFSLLFSPLLMAATAPEKKADDKSPASPIATTISTVTGIAISPLLGTGAYGAYQYFTAPDTPEAKAALPWFSKVSFWLPALLLVGVCAAKDSLGAVVPPGLKKPLDVIETIENKASGLVAAGAVVPFTMDSLSKLIVAQVPHEHLSSGLAMIHLGTIDLSWLLNLLTVPFGLAMFVIVWMASHAINVLILLSPWGAIDAALKTARTALLGLLTLTATINPWVGALLSLVIIVIAYLVAGWAFRLTVFGSIFCWDFLTLRKHRFTPQADANRLFSGKQLTEIGVPVRTYGQLARHADSGKWTFTYKPWLVLPARSVEVQPTAASIGRGLFFSTIRDGENTVFTLPPRYRSHEDQLVKLYALTGGVQDAGLRKAWGALKELFGARAVKSPATVAA